MELLWAFLVGFGLIFAVFIGFQLYKKLRVARMGPPRSRIVNSEKTTTEDKPKTSQTIGMIKCEYCGSLMPQSALSCPTCGASRKR